MAANSLLQVYLGSYFCGVKVPERQMFITDSRNNDHLLWWIAAALLVSGISLWDMAIVAWCASLVTLNQVIACVLSFALIGSGLLLTVWQMRRPC